MLSLRKGVLGCLATLAIAANAALAQKADLSMQGYTADKHKACVSCHRSDPVKAIFQTKHADADNPDTPAAKEECETCHGPSSAHANFPMQVKNFSFGENSPNSAAEQDKVCLDCHEDEQREEWQGSVHEQGELACVSCHVVHLESDPLLDHTKSSHICTDCHTDIRAKQHIKGLHVIEAGKVACTDCHNPHAKLDTGLCLNCHKKDAATLAKQSPKAQQFHATMNKKGLSCLKCHSGVAHGVPSWVDDIRRQQKKAR